MVLHRMDADSDRGPDQRTGPDEGRACHRRFLRYLFQGRADPPHLSAAPAPERTAGLVWPAKRLSVHQPVRKSPYSARYRAATQGTGDEVRHESGRHPSPFLPASFRHQLLDPAERPGPSGRPAGPRIRGHDPHLSPAFQPGPEKTYRTGRGLVRVYTVSFFKMGNSLSQVHSTVSMIWRHVRSGMRMPVPAFMTSSNPGLPT